MEISWRFSALCAACAFVISLFFGIIGGVGFSTLMTRAFLGSLIFAVFGTGAYILVKKLLPDLLGEPVGGEPFNEGVDIVIPDHNPHERTEQDGAFEGLPYEDRRTEAGYDEGPTPGDEEELDGLVEEIEEITDEEGTASRSRPVPTVKTPEPAGGDEAENVDYIDSLPDVGAFSDSFASAHREEGPDKGDFPAGGRSEEKGDRNPAVLAKVVQTLLKREKEG
jgi:hypothetical protein